MEFLRNVCVPLSKGKLSDGARSSPMRGRCASAASWRY